MTARTAPRRSGRPIVERSAGYPAHLRAYDDHIRATSAAAVHRAVVVASAALGPPDTSTLARLREALLAEVPAC